MGGKIAKAPTAQQRRKWDKISAMGCLICGGIATIHHLYTGAGGRKNHESVAPLCWEHHVGPNGIDGRQKYSKKTWQAKFMTEGEMQARVNAYLAECGVDDLIG